MLAKEKRMKFRSVAIPLGIALLFAGLRIPEGKAQEAPHLAKQIQAVHLIGLNGVKDNAKGKLSVEDGKLHFVYGKASSDISINSIQDVVAGADSKKAVGKTVGTVSMAAPYGGGRFLSLFRKKIDTLTIQYRETGGALHGVIFTMQSGTADDLKKDLVAQGAHSVPAEEHKEETKNVAPSNKPSEDQKQ